MPLARAAWQNIGLAIQNQTRHFQSKENSVATALKADDTLIECTAFDVEDAPAFVA